MDDPFFAEDDGEFDDFYGNVSTNARRTQTASQPRRPSEPRKAVTAPTLTPTLPPSMSYPDTPASSVASFMSRSTDAEGNFTATPRTTSSEFNASMTTTTNSTMSKTANKKPKKMRRKRSQEKFEVEWEKDTDVSACYVCATDFSILKRKHHCRHCGRVICSDCSSYWRFSSTHSKHRVCTFCNVELASNGAGRHTVDERSLSDADESTPHHHHHSSLRQSLAGAFGSADTRRQQEIIPPPSARQKGKTSSSPPPPNELFNTGDDTWFTDHPVHDEDHDDDDRGRHTRKSNVAAHQPKGSLRPTVTRVPDSLFDVQFTNQDDDDDESDDGEDRDAIGMPKPPSSSSQLTNKSVKNAVNMSRRGTSSRRGVDEPMTLDDLAAPSAFSASSASTATLTDRAPVPASLKNALTDRPTFYNDDVDSLVVDDAPGYYDSMATRGPPKKLTKQMPRPTTVVAPPTLSETSSVTLVEAPSPPNAASTVATTPSQSNERKEGGSHGFSGALKRFFGISKQPKAVQEEVDHPASTRTTSHIQPPIAVTPPPAATQISPPSPSELIVSATMPRPAGLGGVSVLDSDTYDDYAPSQRDTYTDRGTIASVRYTMVDTHRFQETPNGIGSDDRNGSFRHTMGGYLAPSSTGFAESALRASVVATNNSVTSMASSLGMPAEQAPQIVDKNKKQQRRKSSTRNRRDTFDDLFDSPTKISTGSSPHASAAASSRGTSNLPTRSWTSTGGQNDRGSRSGGGAAVVGVDRFDRPRREDDDADDDLFTKDLRQSKVQEREEPGKTSWNTVSNFRSSNESTTFATPSTYYTASRETMSMAYGGGGYQVGSTIGREEETATTPYHSDYDERSHEHEPKMRSIMDDIKPNRHEKQKKSRPSDSIDDFFADFEKPKDYVFDTASGTYVSASATATTTGVERRSERHSSRSSSDYDRERKREPQRREEPHSSPVRRRSEVLEPVREDAPADEIDGIIADKISTLAGELEALKQLLRTRRKSPAPSESARRKQSIFDSDDSDKDQDKQVEMKQNIEPKAKRRPSSSRKDKDKSRTTTAKSGQRKRKDSFADLFDDEPQSGDTKVLGMSSYEKLFQIGKSKDDSGGGGDGGTSSHSEPEVQKLSKRKTNRGSQSHTKRDSWTGSDGSDQQEERKPLESRFATTKPSSRHTKKIPAAGYDDEEEEEERQYQTATSVVMATATTASDQYDKMTASATQMKEKKKKKKDAIDALFDSDGGEDMGSLFETPAAISASASATVDEVDEMETRKLMKKKEKKEEESYSSEEASAMPLDRKTKAAPEQATTEDKKPRRSSKRRGGSSRQTIEAVADRNAIADDQTKPTDVCSDEEFSSTLKTLRNRRRRSKMPSTKSATDLLLLQTQDEKDGDEEERAPQVVSIFHPQQPASGVDNQQVTARPSDSDEDDDANVMASLVSTTDSTKYNGSLRHITSGFSDSEEEQDSHQAFALGIKVVSSVVIAPSVDHGNDQAEEETELAAAETGVTTRVPLDEGVVQGVEETALLDMVSAAPSSITSPPVENETTAAVDFDPLALLDDDQKQQLDDEDNHDRKPRGRSKKRRGSSRKQREEKVDEPVSVVADHQPWDLSEANTFQSRFKAFKFRDSLLDNDSDLLGPPPSLNLDDLLGGGDGGDSHSDGDDGLDRKKSASGGQERSDDYSFSFEIKPKKRGSQHALPLPMDPPPMPESMPMPDQEQGVDHWPLGHQDESVLSQPTSSRSMALSVTSVDDEVLGMAPLEVSPYQDDWQKLQAQEKERKRKLILKQRQAQRDKLLKKQPASSSTRSLAKDGSSRAITSTSSSSFVSSPTAADATKKEKKKKKKHHKSTTDANENDAETANDPNTGNGDEESSSRRRKSDKRRHTKESTQDVEPSTSATLPQDPGSVEAPPSSYTEL